MDDSSYLSCLDTIISLNAITSSNGSEFEYYWSTLDGHLVDGINTLNPTVDLPGNYILEVKTN